MKKIEDQSVEGDIKAILSKHGHSKYHPALVTDLVLYASYREVASVKEPNPITSLTQAMLTAMRKDDLEGVETYSRAIQRLASVSIY